MTNAPRSATIISATVWRFLVWCIPGLLGCLDLFVSVPSYPTLEPTTITLCSSIPPTLIPALSYPATAGHTGVVNLSRRGTSPKMGAAPCTTKGRKRGLAVRGVFQFWLSHLDCSGPVIALYRCLPPSPTSESPRPILWVSPASRGVMLLRCRVAERLVLLHIHALGSRPKGPAVACPRSWPTHCLRACVSGFYSPSTPLAGPSLCMFPSYITGFWYWFLQICSFENTHSLPVYYTALCSAHAEQLPSFESQWRTPCLLRQTV